MFDYVSNILNTSFLSDIISNFKLINIFELGLIVLVIYSVYRRFIRGTQSEKLLKGIIMLFGALVLSKFLILLNLQILGKFLETLVNIILIALVVVFQPELRRFLGYLGQPGFLSRNLFSSDSETQESNFIEEISDAVRYLSKSRTGALIVIQDNMETENYFEVGTKLNALVSTELLLTIFHPNTALHDGAVVINNGKVKSAGVLLPLTEDPKLSWQYGTRHRAAIGMSEVSDSVCIVVSEETGNISIVQAGELTHCESEEELKDALEELYGVSDTEADKAKKLKKFQFNNIFSADFAKFPNILGGKKEVNKK